MVKRWVLDTMNSGASMEEIDKYTPNGATRYVLASDYDALEAVNADLRRALFEAERLLQEARNATPASPPSA